MASPAFKPQDLIGKPLERAFKLKKEQIDVEARTARQVALTSDEPILHWVNGRGIAYVILDHAEKSINLDRCKAGAAFLENHDPDKRLGRVRNPTTDGHVLRGDIRFSSRPYSNEIFGEVQEDLEHGDSPGTSSGFTIERIADKVESFIGDIPVVRATKWTFIEGSLASIEADLKTGFGRCIGDRALPKSEAEDIETADEPDDNPTPDLTSKARTTNMNEAERLAAEAAARATNPLVVLETRTNDFVKFALIFGNDDEQKRTLTEIAREFALTGKSEEELKAKIMEQRTAWSAAAPLGMPKLTEEEQKRYSITRAILADASMRDRQVGGDTQCLELDISQEIEKRIDAPGYKPHGGIYLPTDMALRGRQTSLSLVRSQPGGLDLMKRVGLDTLTDTKGQELVFTEAGSFIDLLRKKAMVVQLGAKVLSGLQGNVAFPKQIGAGTFSWVAENPGSDVADSNLTLDQVLLSPKTGMSSTSYSRQLLRQSVVDIDGLVMSDLAAINALGIDLAALHGLGSANQPRGIYNTSGIGSVTFAGAITFPKVVDMETAIAGVDADIGTMAYLTTPNVRGKAKQTPVVAGEGIGFIWQNGQMNGYRAEATNQILKTLGTGGDHGMVFGVWGELMIGEWGALEIITDPYRLKKQGMIEVTSFVMVDVAPRYPEAFVKAVTLVP